MPILSAAVGALCVLALLARDGRADAPVWMKLFDGADLKGWQCRTANWKVDTTAKSVVGTGAITFNTFLITDSMFSDFHFKVTARLPGSGGYRNSGVVYRGKITNPTNFEVGGYQADISDGYWGSFYHEQGNELPWTPVSTCSPKANTDWATLEIIADKDKVTHLVDGKSCWEHSGFKVTTAGIIALQLHNPGDFKVEFKDVYIQPVNGSFSIPADRAVDKDGKPIPVSGLSLPSKDMHASLRGSAVHGWYDVNGKSLSIIGADADGFAGLRRTGLAAHAGIFALKR